VKAGTAMLKLTVNGEKVMAKVTVFAAPGSGASTG
jgi:hypothetical protein